MKKTEFIKNYKKAKNLKSSKELEDGKGKLNKSEGYYQFDNVRTRVDSTQHDLAEKTADQSLIDYLKASLETAELPKVSFAKGTLSVYKRDTGLYSGFFADSSGQVIEQFNEMTIPMLAKALMVKNLYTAPQPSVLHPSIDSPAKYIKIKYGDLELEIKKSLSSFIKDYKQQKSDRVKIMKAIQAWRRNSIAGQAHQNDLGAAKDLLENWKHFSEEFYQILEAMKKRYE